MRLFVGDDWAEDHHDVELMDPAGRVLAKRRLSRSGRRRRWSLYRLRKRGEFTGHQPIVFGHGWPLSADDWDSQMMFFLLRGCAAQ